MKLIICALVAFCCYRSPVSAQTPKTVEKSSATAAAAQAVLPAKGPGFPGGYQKFAEFL